MLVDHSSQLAGGYIQVTECSIRYAVRTSAFSLLPSIRIRNLSAVLLSKNSIGFFKMLLVALLLVAIFPLTLNTAV